MKNKETLDFLRNQSQLIVHGYREVGRGKKGRRDEQRK